MNKNDRDRFIIDAMMYLMSEHKARVTKGRLIQTGAQLLYGRAEIPENDQGKIPCERCAEYKHATFWERKPADRDMIQGLHRVTYKYCPICGRPL